VRFETEPIDKNNVMVVCIYFFLLNSAFFLFIKTPLCVKALKVSSNGRENQV